jgi:uracil-DNA glycosylase
VSGYAGRVDAAAELEAIAEEIRAHAGCGSEPCESCGRFVPGEGDARADVVLVGEAPGASEDEAGRPFVGRAGRLLDELLEAAGLRRSDVFITNVVKARPPGNRDPRPDEIAHHRPWLDRQLAVIRPRVIVPLGRHALACFLPGVRIGEVHGQPLEVGPGEPVLFPLYHPAAGLRSTKLRATLFDDVRRLRAAL